MMIRATATEAMMQGLLMHWCMKDLRHELVIPNPTSLYAWEADLISVTKTMLTHEYEVKINLADYRRDAEKVAKHNRLRAPKGDWRPNYFWYATFDFEIDPPDHAGWIKVSKNSRGTYVILIMHPAPRLHDTKINDKTRNAIARLLSWRIANSYRHYFEHPIKESQ